MPRNGAVWSCLCLNVRLAAVSGSLMPGTAAPLSPPEQQVADFLSDILNLETIEVGFNCFLTHRPEIAKANQDNFKEEFVKLMRKLGAESQGNVDTAVKYFLSQTAANTNSKKLEQLFDILQHAVNHHAVPARLACDNILNCDKLVRIIFPIIIAIMIQFPISGLQQC